MANDIKHIHILGNKHPIVFSPTPLIKGRGKNADFGWGEIEEGKDGAIRIYRGSNYVVLDTFWHEVFHSILDGLGRTDLSRDEKFVCRLACAVTDMLLRNKPLPAWILELTKNG